MTLTAWLRDPNPASRLQSRMVQSYLSWLRFRRNHLAMLGLENSTYGRVADVHRLLPDSGKAALTALALTNFAALPHVPLEFVRDE